jgi:peptide/nickel transport system substrate-binding protein
MKKTDLPDPGRRSIIGAAVAAAAWWQWAPAFAAGSSSNAAGALDAGAPVRGGTLVGISLPAGEPQVLTAAFNQSGVNSYISTKIFDGLVRFGPNSAPQPELAETWVISSDSGTVRFNLRKGVKWHDGKPFTSADVRYSYEEVWTKLHPRARSIFAGVTAFETPDDHTLIFRMKTPPTVLFSALNSGELQILPRHLYAGTDVTRNPWNLKPVGTGPFRFKEWVRGERVVLERNPDYWDAGKPYLDGFVLRFIPDTIARYAAFETGAVQYGVLSPVSFNDVNRVRKSPQLRLEFRGYDWLASRVAMEFNVRRKPLNDVRVRRAIAHAIDLPTMSKVVSRGLTTPGTSPVVSTLTDFYTNDVAHYPYDPKIAERLLDEAGITRKADGTRFTVKIDWLPFGGQYQRYGEFVVQALRRVGIEAELRGQDLPQYINRVYTEYDFDIAVTHSAGYGDPQTGTERLFWSRTITQGIPWTNATGYRSAEMDAIIDGAHAALDEPTRVEQYKKLQRLAQVDLPSFTMLENRHYTICSSKLHGINVGSAGCYDSLKDAWLEA